MKTAEDIVGQKQKDIVSVPTGTTIQDALGKMISHKIGAILVTDSDRIVGIWTERDLMRNVVTSGFDPSTALIESHMVADLQASPHTDTVHQLMDKFLGLRLRHLLVEKDGGYIGLLSIGDVIKACLQERTEKLKELNEMVSWEYYEHWSA